MTGSGTKCCSYSGCQPVISSPDSLDDWDRIERKLTKIKSILVTNGAVFERKLPSGQTRWVVRYTGGRVG